LAKKKKTAEKPAGETLGFEEALAELEKIVQELEEGQLPLDDTLARYEQGAKHLKQCYHLLQKAERKIESLLEVDSEGNAVTEPFSDEDDDVDAPGGLF